MTTDQAGGRDVAQETGARGRDTSSHHPVSPDTQGMSVVYTPFSSPATQEASVFLPRSEALKALLEKHARAQQEAPTKETAPAEETAPTLRTASLKTLLSEHVANTSQHTDNAHSKVLDLDYLVKEITGYITVRMTLSNPKAGILAGHTPDAIEVAYDSAEGSFMVRGPAEDVRLFLSELHFTPNVQAMANFYMDIEVNTLATSVNSERLVMLYEGESGYFVSMMHGNSFGAAQLFETTDLGQPTRPLEVDGIYIEPTTLLGPAPRSELFGTTTEESNTRLFEATEGTDDALLTPSDSTQTNDNGNTDNTIPEPSLPDTPPIDTEEELELPENLTPVAVNDFFSFIANGTAHNFYLTQATNRGILDNDSDPEGDTLSLVSIDATGSAGGRVVQVADGHYAYYAPADTYEGTDTVRYTISDGNGNTSTATITFRLALGQELLLTPALNDRLFGGETDGYSGIAADWHVGDTIEGAGLDDVLTITSGTVNVDTSVYTNIHGVEHFVFSADAAHNLVLDASYFARPDLNGEITITTGATTNAITVDASAAPGATNAIYVTGSALGDTLLTGAGADSVTGGDGGDTLTTGGGNDTILAGDGLDTIDAGAGDDMITAGTFSVPSPSGYVAAYDASNPANLTLDVGVTNWNDLSVNNHDAIQATNAEEPQTGVDTIGGLNALTFDGVDDVFNIVNAPLINLSNADEHSIFATFKTGADVTSRQFIYEQGGSGNGFSLYIYNGNFYVGAWKGSGGNFDLFLSAPVAPNTEYSGGLVFDFPNDTFEGFLNGVSIGSTNGLQQQGAHSGMIGMGGVIQNTRHESGGFTGDGFYFGGAIGEFLIYNTALNAAQTAAVDRYFADKWGTPSPFVGGDADIIDGGAGTDTLQQSTYALSTTLGVDSEITSIENFDLTATDLAHNITLTDAYYTAGAGVENNRVSIDAGGNSTGINIDGSALSAGNALSVTASDGGDTIRAGAAVDDIISFASINGGINADINAASATKGATNYGISGFEHLTGSAFADTLSGGAGGNSIDGGAGDDIIYDDGGAIDISFNSLVLHLDATVPSSLTIATGVSAWDDQSTDNNDGIQGTASRQPLSGGDIAGENALIFDGINDYFHVNDSANINTGGQDERSVFAVFETGADITTRQVIYEQGGNGNGFNIYIFNGNLYLAAWKGSGGSLNLFIPTPIAANTQYTAGFIFDWPNTSFSGYLNGTLLNTLAVGQTQGSHSGDIGIGALNNASFFETGQDTSSQAHYFQGEIAELLNYSYALTASEQSTLQSYFNQKYSLTPTAGDTLTGGAGRDYFSWTDNSISLGANVDRVTDFSQSDGDKIDFLGITLPTFQMTGLGALTGQVNEIVWSQSGANTLIQLDQDGDAAADLEVQLDNFTAASLTDEDFRLPGVTLTGTSAADTLTGAVGSDTIAGGLGDDQLTGNSGDDLINGGPASSSVPAGSVIWFDADNAASITTATGVSAWDDQSTANNDASQGTGSAQPQTGVDTINGLNVLTFDGVNDLLGVANTADINTGGFTGRSLFATFETSADITSRQVIYEQGGGTNGYAMYIFNGDLYVGAWRDNGGTIGHWFSTPIAANSEYTAGFVFDRVTDNDFTGYLSGTAFGTGALAADQASHTGAIGIGGMNNSIRHESGSSGGNGFYFEGKIAEILNFNTALSDDDRQQLEIYLSQKWGTPYTAPIDDDDTLSGGNGEDTLNGGMGDDSIQGGAGDDTITGGIGQDTMEGGLNSDVFVFDAVDDSGIGATNRDVISDFSQAQNDQIDLSNFTGSFTLQSGGNGTADFAGVQQVAWEQTGGNTIVYVDTDGDNATDFEIEITGLHTLIAGDFML